MAVSLCFMSDRGLAATTVTCWLVWCFQTEVSDTSATCCGWTEVRSAVSTQVGQWPRVCVHCDKFKLPASVSLPGGGHLCQKPCVFYRSGAVAKGVFVVTILTCRLLCRSQAEVTSARNPAMLAQVGQWPWVCAFSQSVWWQQGASGAPAGL